MAQPSDFFKNPTARNTVIGIGMAILLPVVVKASAPFVRPVARSLLKMGMVSYEKSREAVAEFGEIIDDMVAEVREELRAEREQTATDLGEFVDKVEVGDATGPENNSTTGH